ncbi:MAG TPA: hypothetical protein VFR90_06010 [Methylibium sp.]|uniref:hypothetical protein n=1 Tax=Methylibium sp. TaxID=2067992 RepID=UPI002DB5CB1C|nr:hypothetical protein [Methylibium sp.]HEU4458659.1 hypothetical protein [Methylibium sp.]
MDLHSSHGDPPESRANLDFYVVAIGQQQKSCTAYPLCPVHRLWAIFGWLTL